MNQFTNLPLCAQVALAHVVLLGMSSRVARHDAAPLLGSHSCHADNGLEFSGGGGQPLNVDAMGRKRRFNENGLVRQSATCIDDGQPCNIGGGRSDDFTSTVTDEGTRTQHWHPMAAAMASGAQHQHETRAHC